jgi:TonB family protein
MSFPVDSIVRGTLLLLLALACMPALGRQSAALRHLVLAVALAGALLAPMIGPLVPTWVVPTPVAAAWPSAWPSAARLGQLPPPTVEVARAEPRLPLPSRFSLADVIAGVWLGGVAVNLFILLAGLARLRSLTRRGRRLTSGAWAEHAARLSADGSRALACVETSHPTLLATTGVFRPTLLVPRAAREWAPERVALVVAHESAHVRRGDWPIQIGAEIVRAIHWFNPLAWIVCARLRREAEQACDDAVLNDGVSGHAYAEELIAIVGELRGARTMMPVMPVVHPSGFERRVTHMLTPTLNRRRVTRRTAAIVAIIGLAVLLPLAGLAAQAVRASVAGSVSDPQRGVLPGVKLTLTHTTTGQKLDIDSDSSGRFVFDNLEPGDYLLEARLPGFALYQTTATVSGDGRTMAQNVTLQVATVRETITISEPASGPRATRTPTVDQEQFRRLEEMRRKRAAQVCTTTPERPASFIGGNLRAPAKFVDVRPSYPEHLRTAGVTGSVNLAARIGIDGLVEDIRVLSATDPAFATAATDAVSRWEFDATLLNCVPMVVDVNISVQFDLER